MMPPLLEISGSNEQGVILHLKFVGSTQQIYLQGCLECLLNINFAGVSEERYIQVGL